MTYKSRVSSREELEENIKDGGLSTGWEAMKLFEETDQEIEHKSKDPKAAPIVIPALYDICTYDEATDIDQVCQDNLNAFIHTMHIYLKFFDYLDVNVKNLALASCDIITEARSNWMKMVNGVLSRNRKEMDKYDALIKLVYAMRQEQKKLNTLDNKRIRDAVKVGK